MHTGDKVMEKKVFFDLLNEFILPLFTGSYIDGEEESSSRDSEVALGNSGTIVCKAQKKDSYRFIIKRQQPFRKFEVQLIKAILEEISKIYKFQVNESAYNKNLQQYALQKAICKSINKYNYKTLLDLIYELTNWSTRTYEGQNTSFGFLISPRYKNDSLIKLHFSDIITKDFSALLSDGVNSCLRLNAKGYLLGYVNLPENKLTNTLAPIDYTKLAKASNKGKIGIALMPNGDLLIFQDEQLVFRKSRGVWNCFCHEELIDRIQVADSGLKEAIYLSALDVSFAKSGGIICSIKKEQINSALNQIDINDILIEDYYNAKVIENDTLLNFVNSSESSKESFYPSFDTSLTLEKCVKVATLRQLIGNKKFQDLDRRFRRELISIDGATVIDNEGNIISIGAIIKIEAGSTGGGRLSATKTLAHFGTSIKISMDGNIQCLSFDNKNQRVKSLFMI